MSLKQYIGVIFIGTLIMWGGWFVVVTQIDPIVAGMIGMMLFYSTFFLALLGTFALIGAFYHLVRQRGNMDERHIILSFRHAIWYSLVVNFTLYLQAKRLLSWTNLLILVLLLAIIEFLLLSRHRHTQSRI
ncbi:MAG: hypothetical protein HOJ15_03135 [Candidatus Jacksonbacteria bacterium]|jgi:hypothetical protein|nr:hypothetical protein [Candidatus Jacksonbacteria bacterium]MBT6034486.1 hypothetical protein [Candidatus Jacksonbacteria bacterium]MBT6301392.1 hypothetical protein [Candidatus Jacksonbacteria bacterium]MBT6757836.1 hypothetical protein [Candidatus Jacksonbacteria bacterium]MBT6955374.1 hypothetical protein [Candidatus Jacksonbacteria bacterium]